MIVLQQQTDRKDFETIVLLFGIGLIGSSVHNSITGKGNYTSFYFPFDWKNKTQSRQDAQQIYNQVVSLFIKSSASSVQSGRIAIIWSAGKAGFFASAKDTAEELANYDIILGLVQQLCHTLPEVRFHFHLTSSAGGLFEGKRLVNWETTPVPGRYYGRLKQEQENRLTGLNARIIKTVYRPTSVYGYSIPGQRMGLIQTLIANGIKNKVSTIFGSYNTLRDYIFNDDIGHFIARHLFQYGKINKTTVHLLGTGKPSSIYEIKYLTEQIIGKKMYLEFRTDSQVENSTDITISSSALPDDLRQTDIKNGMRYIREKILSENA